MENDRFVQISACGGDNDGAVYALDEAGRVWIYGPGLRGDWLPLGMSKAQPDPAAAAQEKNDNE